MTITNVSTKNSEDLLNQTKPQNHISEIRNAIPFSYLRLHVKPILTEWSQATHCNVCTVPLVILSHLVSRRELAQDVPAVNDMITQRWQRGEMVTFSDTGSWWSDWLLYFKHINAPFYHLISSFLKLMKNNTVIFLSNLNLLSLCSGMLPIPWTSPFAQPQSSPQVILFFFFFFFFLVVLSSFLSQMHCLSLFYTIIFSLACRVDDSFDKWRVEVFPYPMMYWSSADSKDLWRSRHCRHSNARYFQWTFLSFSLLSLLIWGNHVLLSSFSGWIDSLGKASALWPYYQQQKIVQFFIIVVTDEIENVKFQNQWYFPSLVLKYYHRKCTQPN